MNKFLILSLIFITGCASQVQKVETKAALKAGDQEPTKPTYAEKVAVMEVDDLNTKTPCPRDGAWNGLEWKKIILMANACVGKKDWRRVDAIGEYLGVHAHLTPWGAYYMSLAAGARKDYPRAVWMMELALKKAPGEGLFHYQLGRMYWATDDETAALKELKIASDMNAGLTDAHWVMGQIAMQRGDMVEAERLLGKALDNDGKHFGALMAMASIKGKTKDWSRAAGYLVQATRANPKNAGARKALMQIQEKMKAEQAEISATKKVTSRKPAEKKKVSK